MANRFQVASIAFVIDLEFWEVNYLDGIQQEQLSKTGDSDRVLLVAELTMTARNPSSSAMVKTLTTS